MALALRPAPRPKRIRARCLLYACRISRSAVPPPGARLTGRRFPKGKFCQPSFNIGTGSLEQTSPVLAESVTYTGVFCQTARRFCLENENLMKSHKYKSSIHLSKNGFFVGILFYRRFSLHNTEKMFICSICQKGS